MAIAIRMRQWASSAALSSLRRMAACMRALALGAVAPQTRLHKTPQNVLAAISAPGSIAVGSQIQTPRRRGAGISEYAESETKSPVSTGWSGVRRQLLRWVRVPEVQVVLVATILSIAAYTYYSRAGLLFAYGDAVSHLIIARRVLMSRTPGIAQLGSVWLPLSHILMLPLVWITPLYRDGFAAGFPSMLSYVLATLYMYRLAKEVVGSRAAGYLGAAVIALNPNLLYMQTTAMTESALVCCTAVLAFYLVRWSNDEQLTDIIKCALACLAATLVRYDGWALTVSCAAIVLAVTWRRYGWARARALALLYSLLAFAGCAGWIMYDQVIFGSGFDFYSGPYSAMHQQEAVQAAVGLPTHHNLLLSLHVYAQVAIDNLTPIVSIAAVVGLSVFLLRRLNLTALVLFVPFVFNWLALFMGVTAVTTPEIPFKGQPAVMFNGRYGLEMLPAAALLVAAITAALVGVRLRWQQYSRLAVLVACVITLAVTAQSETMGKSSYVLEEPLRGGVVMTAGAMRIGSYLHSHYDGGLILISDSFADVVFFANLPDRAFLTDSENKPFSVVVHDPALARWIVVDPNSTSYDTVWYSLPQGWQQHFVLRADIGGALLYQRIGG